MTKEDKFIQLELTLGELGVKTVFSKSGQNQSEMFIMLFVCFRIDEDVIDVDNDELVEIILKIEFMSLMKVAGALVRPKDMTVYS